MTTRNPTANFPGELRKPARHFSPAYVARNLIRGRLSGLSGGMLGVRDAWGDWDTGECAGEHIWLNVEDPTAYLAILTGGSLGAASAYMDGKWSCSDLSGLLRLFIRNMSVVAGAVMFFLSDLSVAALRLVQTDFPTYVWGLPLYYAGQVCLALSTSQSRSH